MASLEKVILEYSFPKKPTDFEASMLAPVFLLRDNAGKLAPAWLMQPGVAARLPP